MIDNNELNKALKLIYITAQDPLTDLNQLITDLRMLQWVAWKTLKEVE